MKITSLPTLGLVLLFSLARPDALGAGETKPPLYEGLGTFSRKVTTASPEAQRYFDQGLAFNYGFAHEAAIRSYQEATRLDPQCAMAWWGIANACGPNINLPMVDADHAALAWAAVTKAQAAAAAGTPVERALIAAQAKRYAEKYRADRRALDEAYAGAMREAWHAHPEDADVGALFAEAMMDLRPWDQWQPDGQPQPGTEEVIAALRTVVAAHPDHPMGLHLTIHAYEASANPAVAQAAADRLRGLRSLIGHLEHMPSHLDVRTGHWLEAVDANERAIASDRRYRQVVGEPDGMLAGYMAHNRHMQAYAAMMTGQSALALRTIRAMVAELPADVPPEFLGFIDAFTAMPYEVMVRFGRWDEILAAPEPAEKFAFSRALRLAARGIAFAAQRQPAAAFGTNPMVSLLDVAEHMLAGEILLHEGRTDEGLAELREGVKREDALHYDEPPGWIIPVRHSLGASLMAAGQFAEAEAVYRADLKKLPANGWSLYGLAECLGAQGRKADAEKLHAEFLQTWVRADMTITSSCLCFPKP